MSVIDPFKLLRFTKKVIKGWTGHSSKNSVSLSRQFQEVYKLLKLNRLEPEEYYRYSLFRDDLSWEDKTKYMSDNQYYLIEGLMNPRKEVGVLNKLVFRTYTSYFNLPMPELLGVFERHFGYTVDGKKLCTPEDLRAFLNNPAVSEFIMKPASGGKGKGVLSCKSNLDGTVIVHGKGNMTAEELHEYLSTFKSDELNLSPDVYVIEKTVRQHKFFDNYSKTATQGARVLTYINSHGEIEVVTVHQKIAFSGKFIDNIVGHGIAVVVDENGIMGVGNYFGPEGFKKYDKHPETDFPITGQKMPFFKEAVDLAVKAQSVMPQLRFVGWDLAITDDGPLLFEGNHGWGHQGMQQIEKEGFIRGGIKSDMYELMRKHG